MNIDDLLLDNLAVQRAIRASRANFRGGADVPQNFFHGLPPCRARHIRSKSVGVWRQVPDAWAIAWLSEFVEGLEAGQRPALQHADAAKALTNGAFGAVMDVAGHRLNAVSDRAPLERALASGKVDLVLADPTISREISGIVNTSSTATVVPILYNSAASERATFVKEFGCILRLPADPRAVIDALDKAMKLHAKRLAAHSA